MSIAKAFLPTGRASGCHTKSKQTLKFFLGLFFAVKYEKTAERVCVGLKIRFICLAKYLYT